MEKETDAPDYEQARGLYAQVLKLTGYFKNAGFYAAHKSAIDEAFYCVQELYSELPPSEQLFFDANVDALKCELDIYTVIYIESFQLALLENPADISRKLLRICELATSGGLQPLESYYICFQTVIMAFRDSRLSTPGHLTALARENAVCWLKAEAKQTPLDRIPQAERDMDFMVVLTSQLLGVGHGPTKTALDRCVALQRMNKRVKLICTREMDIPSGEAPFYRAAAPKIRHEYSSLDSLTYEGVNIPFHQCGEDMPNIEEITELVSFIKETRPGLVISIGESLVADLIDGLVPVITVATVFSQIPHCQTTFISLGGKAAPEQLKLHNIDPESVIESVFTFKRLSAQKELTREDLELPADKFLMLVVGVRLDFEVTDEFLDCALGTAEAGTYIVFMGTFRGYEEKCLRMPLLGQHSSFIGFQSDVAAVNRVCDLYINPKRQGGGGSAAEAMCEGLPVVTLGYGDCATCAGADFQVKDFHGMREMILKYVEDNAFYGEMSERAKKRAAELTDTDRHFKDVIDKALNSRLYR